MSDKYNPFKENRAEQMRDLWKYYVPFDGLESSGKPIIVEGGRGSGKTMFFQCNSWREKSIEFQKDGRPLSDLINEEFIGLYYRVDTAFVSSMQNGEEENWDKVFETYLGICILKEVIDLLIGISSSMSLDEKKLSDFVSSFSEKLDRSCKTEDLRIFRKNCDKYLDAIEDKINGAGTTSNLRYVKVHRFIADVCTSVTDLVGKRELLFKIFIDEYETLQNYQQRIVNTLIKHSALPVIYNIGLKPHGMRTIQTISETETIEAPHDYELVVLGFENAKYSQLLKEICRKRIELGKDYGKIPSDAPNDIEYYLGKYSIDEELNRIMRSKNLPHISDLRELIKERGHEENCSESDVQKYIKTLCDDANILQSRIHYALLKKKTQYTPTLSELFEEYSNNTNRYQEWIHNRKYGAIFLLCKETKRRKMYFGFDVYTMLSSNNVRGFLELCEQAFKFSFLKDYQWNSPLS